MIFVFTFLASVNGPAQDAWNITAQMTVGRYFFESQALNDYQVLIIGGMSGTGVTSSVEYYDARTKSCTQVARMREPRYALSFVLPAGSCDVTIPLLTLGNGAYRMLIKDIKGAYSVPLIIAR